MVSFELHFESLYITSSASECMGLVSSRHGHFPCYLRWIRILVLEILLCLDTCPALFRGVDRILIRQDLAKSILFLNGYELLSPFDPPFKKRKII
jgi:hypothetical protein